jgi:hypothetical protein
MKLKDKAALRRARLAAKVNRPRRIIEAPERDLTDPPKEPTVERKRNFRRKPK